jgi:serine/threonine protein kinase
MNHMNPRERKAALLRQKQDLEKKEAGLKVMAGKYQL